MGVDTSLKIRVFIDNKTDYKEITVSDQDNSLGSLLFNSGEISYTSIQFDRCEGFSDQENSLLNLIESDEEEMMAYSEIIQAADVITVVEKIHRKLYRIKKESLEKDLDAISTLNISDEEKIDRRKSKIGDYLDFESSFGIFVGIIKMASKQDFKIQIVNEFY